MSEWDFIEAFKTAERWESSVMAYLVGNGIECHRPQQTKPNDGKRSWPSQVDLIANGQLIEVRSRDIKFTSHEDFPYGTVLVAADYEYDLKPIKPLAYVIVSQQTGRMFWFYGLSTEDFSTRVRYHKDKGREFNFYEVDKCRCRPMEDLVTKLKDISAIGVEQAERK